LSRNNENSQQIKVMCRRCEKETNHLVQASVSLFGTHEEYDISWASTYQIIQCRGCDTVSFREEHRDSESCYSDDDFTEILHPKRSHEKKSKDRKVREYSDLPPTVGGIYQETIECYNNGILFLCAAGIRALVEAVCLEKNIRGGNLEQKIDQLHERGFLTKEHSSVLHEHRLLGNEALHKMSVPSKAVLRVAIDIIEAILESLYEMPTKIEELKRARNGNTSHFP